MLQVRNKDVLRTRWKKDGDAFVIFGGREFFGWARGFS